MEENQVLQQFLSSDLIGQFTNTKMLFAGGVLAFVESQNGFLVCIIIPLVLIFFNTNM